MTQSSPTSGSSAFSFSSFWASFSKSSNKSTLTLNTEISNSPSLRPQNGLDCKLIWGISGKSFKPGLLFTPPGRPTTGQLLLLQMGKSFKTQCIEEPNQVIETLQRNFSFARSVIPSKSRFAACLTDENYDRLSQLRLDAIFWKQCGLMDSKLLARGPVLQDISGETLDKLCKQPNIFHILGEAAAIFSCIELGIPSPSTSTRSSSANSPSSFSPFTMTSVGDSWLYLEKHAYHGTLQSSLDELLPHDPILSLPIETLQALIDGMTEVQLLLNIWFAPYQRNGEVDEITTESIAAALSQLDQSNAKPAKEGEKLIHAGEIATGNWIRDAANLRRIEHDFNVWNLALQRCERIKSTRRSHEMNEKLHLDPPMQFPTHFIPATKVF